jgi:hypothetical protein
MAPPFFSHPHLSLLCAGKGTTKAQRSKLRQNDSSLFASDDSEDEVEYCSIASKTQTQEIRRSTRRGKPIKQAGSPKFDSTENEVTSHAPRGAGKSKNPGVLTAIKSYFEEAM